MKYRAHRYPTRFPVTVKVGALGIRSLISSVSASGACLQLDQPLGVGQPIMIEYSGNRLRATVRWMHDERAGVVFNRMLGKSELDRIRFGLRGGQSTRTSRVGFAMMQ